MLLLICSHIQIAGLFISDAEMHMIQEAKQETLLLLVDGIVSFQVPHDLAVRIAGGMFLHLIEQVVNVVQKPGQNKQDVVQQVAKTIYPSYKVCFVRWLLIWDKSIVDAAKQPTMEILNTIPAMMLQVLYRSKVPYQAHLLQHATLQRKMHFVDMHLQYKQQTVRIRNTNNGAAFHVSFWKPMVQAQVHIFPEHHHVLVDERTIAGLLALGYMIASIYNRKRTIYALPNASTLYVDETEEKTRVMQIVSKTKPIEMLHSKM